MSFLQKPKQNQSTPQCSERTCSVFRGGSTCAVISAQFMVEGRRWKVNASLLNRNRLHPALPYTAYSYILWHTNTGELTSTCISVRVIYTHSWINTSQRVLTSTTHWRTPSTAARSSFNDGGRRQRHRSGGTPREARCISKWSWGHPFLGSRGGRSRRCVNSDCGVFLKERNLHNFWQMIGRRGRGGKGEEEIRREPNMKEVKRERPGFCKHLNISEAVDSPRQEDVWPLKWQPSVELLCENP